MPHRPRPCTADLEAFHCLRQDLPSMLKSEGSSKQCELNPIQESCIHLHQRRYNRNSPDCIRLQSSELCQRKEILLPKQHDSSIYVQAHLQYSKNQSMELFDSCQVPVQKCRDTDHKRSSVQLPSSHESASRLSTLVSNITNLAIDDVQNSSLGQSYRGYNSKGHGERTVEHGESNAPSHLDQPAGTPTDRGSTFDIASDGHNDIRLNEEIDRELGRKWVLNLSMHFEDSHDREKFFITYVELPNRWRRVTVSCDYRDAMDNTLEGDLRTLHFQRDKSARVYESIRESLPDIQFYESVTNLKLKTEEGRLHVHVAEDVNEVIKYPPLSVIRHLDCPVYPESALNFDSHMSGFVYTVKLDDRVFVKKEIPSPDTVEEFLYEVNALFALRYSKHVIDFIGVVSDDQNTCVKGLLIDYASGGALVDILHDNIDPQIPWAQREAWAQQIVEGLSDIHETGFVQGDFTLSNIVLDTNNTAKIIDINRRGCPVGWEPPELEGLIEDGQKISMYIGVKSDIFQLGMVLWALAVYFDEPERRERPLTFDETDPAVPHYFLRIVKSCLESNPSNRKSAKALLDDFPLLSYDKDVNTLLPRTDNLFKSEMIDPALRFPSEGFGEARQIPSDRDWNSAVNYEAMNNIGPGSYDDSAQNLAQNFITPNENEHPLSLRAHHHTGFCEEILLPIELNSPEVQDHYVQSEPAANGRSTLLGDDLAGIGTHTFDERVSEIP